MTSLTYLFQFYFILELLSIFMVMINLYHGKFIMVMVHGKCLLNVSSVRFFLPRELFLIYPILIWSRSKGLNIIWTIVLAKAIPLNFAVNIR